MTDLQIDEQTKREILDYYETELLVNIGTKLGLNVSTWTSREKLTELLLPKLTIDDFLELLREEDVGFLALSKLTKQEIISNIDESYLEECIEIPNIDSQEVQDYFLKNFIKPLLVLIGVHYSLFFISAPAIKRQIPDISHLTLIYKEATKSTKKKLQDELDQYYQLGIVSEKVNLQFKSWKKGKQISYLLFKGMVHPRLLDKIDVSKEMEENDQSLKRNIHKNNVTKQLVNFSNVYGMDELKEELRLLVIYPSKHPELTQKYHRGLGGGVLLYGPPGCGKTFISKAIAGECGYPFVEIKTSEVLSKWMGESEQKIAEVFKKARSQKPSVLFIDEVDSLMFNRANSDQTLMNSIVNSFLREISDMEKEGILVIASTNLPFNLDPAAVRSGRFSKKIYVGPPDFNARVGLLKFFTKNKPFDELNYDKLANRTGWFSNSDIEDLVNKVLEIPYREAIKSKEERKANMNDFLEVLKTKTPTTIPYFADCEKKIKNIQELGQYNNLIKDLDRIRKHNKNKEHKNVK